MASPPVFLADTVTAFGAEATSQAASSPSATEVGNVLLCQVTVINASVTVATPAGWTKIGQESVAGELVQAWFWKLATEAGAKSTTFSWVTNALNVVQITAVKGNDPTTPIAAFAIKLNATSSKEMKFASVSPTMTNTLSVLMGASGNTSTPPAGYTERIDTTACYEATAELAASGASGEKVVTMAEAGETATCHVAVAPKPVTETGVKATSYSTRTSVELTAAELKSAGIAAGNGLVIIVLTEKQTKPISVAAATGSMAASQQEISGDRYAAFYISSWDGTTAIKATWEGSESTGCNLTVQGWSGHDTTTPMDATAVWSTFTSTSSAVAAGITTVTAGAVEGVLVGGNNGTAVGTTPEGWNRNSEFLLWRTRPTAGATGTTTFTLTGSDTGVTLTYAIRPKEEGKPKSVSLTDSTTPTESLTKKVTKGLSDSTTPSVTFTKKATKGLAESITPTETWGFELIGPEPEPEPEPAGPMVAAAVLSEPVDDTLFVKLTTAEGGNNRLSGIEDQAENIATGITTSNTAPGGHRSAGMNVLRDPRRDFPDLNFIDDVVIYGRTKPLGRNVFEGMNEQFPAQLADGASIAINAVGNQALLSENEAWKALYVDLGFSNWREAGRIRKEALANAGVPQGKISLSTDEDGLVWTVPSGQTLAAAEITEAVYGTRAGCPLGLVGYKGTRVKDWTKFEAPQFIFAEDETFGVVGVSSTNLLNGTPEMYDIVGALHNAPRWAMLRAYTLGAVTPEAGTQQAYSELAAYGDTGIPLREIPGHLPGVYGHDVLAHIVSTGAPDLNYTVGGDGSIVPNTSFIMPNFAPTEPGKPWDAIEKLNAYFLNNFGVFDNKEFFWKPWDPEDVNWQISIAGGAQWSPVGRQAVTLLNQLVVNYTDSEGVSRCAGPPGSGCDFESPLLVNPDPTNPYTRRGRKRCGTLNVGFPLAYPTTAFQVGSIVLAESMMPQRSGSLTIRPLGPGHVPSITHPTMGRLPVWALRAGDFATLMDWPVPEALRVTEVDYTHDTKTLTAQLDSGAARLTAILERTGSSLTV